MNIYRRGDVKTSAPSTQTCGRNKTTQSQHGTYVTFDIPNIIYIGKLSFDSF